MCLVTGRSGGNLNQDGYLLTQQYTDWYHKIQRSILHVEETSFTLQFLLGTCQEFRKFWDSVRIPHALSISTCRGFLDASFMERNSEEKWRLWFLQCWSIGVSADVLSIEVTSEENITVSHLAILLRAAPMCGISSVVGFCSVFWVSSQLPRY